MALGASNQRFPAGIKARAPKFVIAGSRDDPDALSPGNPEHAACPILSRRARRFYLKDGITSFPRRRLDPQYPMGLRLAISATAPLSPQKRKMNDRLPHVSPEKALGPVFGRESTAGGAFLLSIACTGLGSRACDEYLTCDCVHATGVMWNGWTGRMVLLAVENCRPWFTTGRSERRPGWMERHGRFGPRGGRTCARDAALRRVARFCTFPTMSR